MQTNLEWYRSFVAVYRAGTVTAAARALFMTQPGVSGHLAALEQAVGAPLFTRTTRRMVPTDDGKALYARVAGAVERLEQVEGHLGAASTDVRPLVRLGAPREWFHAVGVAAVAGTEARVRVAFGSTGELLGALRAGDLDVVVATQRARGRDVTAQRIATEAFWIMAPPGLDVPSEFAEADGASEERVGAWGSWLAELPWVSYGADLPIVRRFWRGAFGVRPPFEPVLVVPDLLTVCEAVALGVGVSLVPYYLCRPAVEAGRITVVPPLRPTAPNDLYAVTRSGETRASVDAVIERIQSEVVRVSEV